jgi:hypothetical protein
MKMLVIGVAALLAGCITTPQQVREQGQKITFSTAQPPAQTARCLARAAENVSGNFAAQERMNGDGTQEVLVRSVGDIAAVLVIADIHPTGAGSSVTLSVGDLAHDSLLKQLKDGC